MSAVKVLGGPGERHAWATGVLALGLSGDDEVEIISGLAAGDKVVTTAALLLDAEAEMNNE